MNIAVERGRVLRVQPLTKRQDMALEVIEMALSNPSFVPPPAFTINLPPRPGNPAEKIYYWDVTIKGNTVDSFHDDTTYTITVVSFPEGGKHVLLDITDPDTSQDVFEACFEQSLL